MRLIYNKTKFLLFSFAWFVFLCMQANAYVLSGPHILELMTEKLGKPKKLQVEQKLIIYRDITDNTQEQTQFNETMSYMFPDYFRSDIYSENIQKTYLVVPDDSIVIVDGQIGSVAPTEFDFYKDILLYRSRIILEEKLPLLGIDLSISSLGRFQDRIAYIIGAKYPDESASQIWVDKESFKPLRWIVLSRKDDHDYFKIEIRYLNWRKYSRTWYPKTIEFYQNNLLVRVIQVTKVNPIAKFNDNLFDIEQMREMYHPKTPEPIDNKKPDDLDEIKKTIEDFNKIFE